MINIPSEHNSTIQIIQEIHGEKLRTPIVLASLNGLDNLTSLGGEGNSSSYITNNENLDSCLVDQFIATLAITGNVFNYSNGTCVVEQFPQL